MNIFLDQRIVLTLDAGGTNFVFSALQGGEPITSIINLPSRADNIQDCLNTIIRGFEEIQEQLLPLKAIAISFAFPGPADYAQGVIINPPNFSSFNGGVALGPMLEDHFGLPTFINNDGNLFTYGEAIGGFLQEINLGFEQLGIPNRFHNLIGITLGTGFGGGIVINDQICQGDNSAAAEVWLMRNYLEPSLIAEESVSVRGIQQYYREQTGSQEDLSPKEIYEIAIRTRDGETEIAIEAFDRMARVIAEALSNMISVIDGAVVIGGGIAGSSKILLPRIITHLHEKIRNRQGDSFRRIVSEPFSFEDENSKSAFFQAANKNVSVPFSNRQISFSDKKRIPIGISRLGTNKATMLGAYAFALNKIEISAPEPSNLER